MSYIYIYIYIYISYVLLYNQYEFYLINYDYPTNSFFMCFASRLYYM